MATLKRFQEEVCDGVVARFRSVRDIYNQLSKTSDPSSISNARKQDGAVVLQAPTGSGKTLIALEAVRRFSREDKVLWFWFAPFSGLIQQTRSVIATNAPELRLLEIDSDRRLDAVRDGGVFVATWASVAAKSTESRRARTTGDSGVGLDTLIDQARAEGIRIGCVVDEAHHGFHSAMQARIFFSDVLTPDYALMMTATPRDRDASTFERDTGYRVGEPSDWASVSRFDAVEEKLLKRGVRMVRFLARDGDAAQLIDFEHLALRECSTMHVRIKKELSDVGAVLTPLMLVQVPDGAKAQQAAKNFLVDSLGFSDSSVRIHTAAEPDPDLIALANDPTVEVLIFKMAVALGFDAPRAFTLAALRGARDAGFGVQVIGRIVRRHALLQSIEGLPALLDHGYVFLANAESQEGLIDAGAKINSLTTRAPELGTQTVVTVIGDTRQVQIARSGEPLSLLVNSVAAETRSAANVETPQAEDLTGRDREEWIHAARDLLQIAGDEGQAAPRAAHGQRFSAAPLVLTKPSVHRYLRREDAPPSVKSERLPAVAEDYETQLADFVDFNHQVLADRLRSNERVTRIDSEIFQDDGSIDENGDVFAELAPEAVAEKAEQIRLRLVDANDRELQSRLVEKFAASIRQSGAQVPSDEELLMQQLDLVLVRNPFLLREAFNRLRLAQVVEIDAPLAPEMQSDTRLESSRRGLYGVFPPGMNEDERAIAGMLDENALVRWWHRNTSDARKPDALGLYRWDDGAGFFPDFLVSLKERDTPDGIALLEVKGGFLWGDGHEVDKAQATHPDYGRVFMVGRERGQRDFVHLRKLGEKLKSDGLFSIDRLRYV